MRITASSPVNIQPSRKVSFVAFALFKYPSTTLGDRIASSPGVSYSRISLPSGVTILASTPGRKLPLEPNQMSVVVVPLTTVAVSVRPCSHQQILCSGGHQGYIIPYPCLIAQSGNIPCNSLAVSAPRGAAPEKMDVTLDRSYFFINSLLRNIVMIMGGT